MSHRRCCVFVVHNSVHCIALVAVGAALGGGHYRSAYESTGCVRFQAAVQMGFSTPNLKIMAELSATRYGLANQNSLHKLPLSKYENYQNVIAGVANDHRK